MLIRTLPAVDIANYDQHQDCLFDYEQSWKRAETLADGQTSCCNRRGCFEVSFFAYLVSSENAGTSLSHEKTMTAVPPYISTHGTTNTAASFRAPTLRSSPNNHLQLQPPSLPHPICYPSVTRKPQNLRRVAYEGEYIGFRAIPEKSICI